MIAEARNKELCADWAEYIQAPQTLDAYRFLVGIAAASKKYHCYCERHGNARSFKFSRDAEIPHSFITTKHWLLFYFRAPAVKKGGDELRSRLAGDFGDAFCDNPNARNEWTLKLRSICDVKRLLTHVDLT